MARKPEAVIRLSNTDRELLRSIADSLERIADEVAPEHDAKVTKLVPLAEDNPAVWKVPAGAGLGYEFGERVTMVDITDFSANTTAEPTVTWKTHPIRRADKESSANPEKNLHEFGPEDSG